MLMGGFNTSVAGTRPPWWGSQCRLWGGVGSASERNTLIFKERWSVRNEISPASIFYEQTEVRDMG